MAEENEGQGGGKSGNTKYLYVLPVIGVVLILVGCAIYRVIKQRQKERAKQKALRPQKIGAKPKAPPPPDKTKAAKTRSGVPRGGRAAARARSRQGGRQRISK